MSPLEARRALISRHKRELGHDGRAERLWRHLGAHYLAVVDESRQNAERREPLQCQRFRPFPDLVHGWVADDRVTAAPVVDGSLLSTARCLIVAWDVEARLAWMRRI